VQQRGCGVFDVGFGLFGKAAAGEEERSGKAEASPAQLVLEGEAGTKKR